MFFFCERISTASAENDGAITTSVKMSFTVSAMRAATSRFAAMTPPKADTGSQACALAWASAIGSSASAEPTATPQGLACLMMATAGSSKSKAARRAASASTKLL